jgi:hypothetical protein
VTGRAGPDVDYVYLAHPHRCEHLTASDRTAFDGSPRLVFRRFGRDALVRADLKTGGIPPLRRPHRTRLRQTSCEL